MPPAEQAVWSTFSRSPRGSICGSEGDGKDADHKAEVSEVAEVAAAAGLPPAPLSHLSRHGDAAFPPPPSIAAALCGAAPRWAQGLAMPVMPDAAAALPCPSASMEEKRAVLQRLDLNPLKRCMIQFSGGFQPERSDE